jgi:transcriptional regulator GlxA family with amidase domain
MNTKLNYIQNWQELAKVTNWQAAALAKKCGVSVRTLERHFIKKMGISPKAWLAEIRQNQTVALLKKGLSIKEVASILQYKHPSHLTNAFKKQCGHYPSNRAAPTCLGNP